MTSRNAFQQLLRAKVIGAIELARAAACVTHQGLKGEILEILVSKLFRPLLPADIGIGTGQILCSFTGRLSSQVDVVLYDKSILPPVLIDSTRGIFPIESVLYAIEVKTTLTKSELSSAHANAEELAKRFGYRPGRKDTNGDFVDHKLDKVKSVVFALSSDLSPDGMNEIDRYGKHFDLSTSPLVALCVAGKEYWYANTFVWYGAKDVDACDGVLGFLAGVMNTYKSIAQSRGAPCLGNYIAPDVSLMKRFVGKNIPQAVCEECGKVFNLTVKVGDADLTVKGALVSRNPCPTCGGCLKTESGTFVTVDGFLKTSLLS